MAMTDAFLQEIDQEGKTTRRVLERVPADRLGWRPHPKSMSLGELALHVAQVPGVIAAWALEDSSNLGGDHKQAQAESTDQVLESARREHDQGEGGPGHARGRWTSTRLAGPGRWQPR